MRIDPPRKEEIDKKANLNQMRVEKITRKIAIVLSFLIIYFFFIKLLFL